MFDYGKVWSKVMEAKAVAKYIRISPQKARLVVDLVRGKKVAEAEKILSFTRKYGAMLVGKFLSLHWPTRNKTRTLTKKFSL